MFQNLSLMILALAVSLDGFGVGISYGLRKIKISSFSIAVITACSGLSIFLSMELGLWISKFVNFQLEKEIGAFILIAIGCWSIFNLFTNREAGSDSSAVRKDEVQVKPVLKINIKLLGIMIQILKAPTKADIDVSGTITGLEALLLGVALSLDAFGAGIGSALMGYSPLETAFLVSLFNAILIFLGMRLGLLYSEVKWLKRISLLPGLILILIGLSRLR